MANRARWTWMVYMAGDNDLSSAADRDLAEMRQVGSTADVNIVVEIDNAGEAGTRRIHVERDGVGERVEMLGETDSGSPQVLSDFIHWAATEYPAERYGLVLWNHGGGWEPTEVDRIAHSVAAPGYSSGEGIERSASGAGGVFFRSSLATILSLPSAIDRAICSDDGTGHSLDMVELGRVLADAVARLGQPLDLLGMDACLMSNFEVAYQVAPYARHLVASEEIEPNQGWPYDEILARLTAAPELPTADLAVNITAAYLAFYEGIGHPDAVTQAALDLSRVDEVAGPLDSLADALAARLPEASTLVWNAQRKSSRFQRNTLWDIAHFAAAVAELGGDAELSAVADAVRQALEPGPGRTVLANGKRGDKVAQCCGVTIYLLPHTLDLSRYYGEVRFASERRWLAMLEKYHAS